MSEPSFTAHFVNKFHDGVYLGAARLAAMPDPLGGKNFLNRGRGQHGRAEAAERGALGSGPAGRLSGGTRQVAIGGLPHYITVAQLKEFLKSFRLAGNTAEAKEVVQLPQYVAS